VAGYLQALVDQASRTDVPQGCLLLNTAATCTTAPPAVLAKASDSLRKTEEALHAALRRDPALATRKDLRPLTRFFAAQAHGLAMLARTGAKPSALREAATVALRVLDGAPTARS
jgi:hypothetical protein